MNEDDICRGMMVCNTENFCHVSEEFYAKVTLLDLLETKSIFSEGYTAMMHIHSVQVDIVIESVECIIDPETKKKFV